jgi:hypothetical protein
LLEHRRSARRSDALRRLTDDVDTICRLLGLDAGRD